MLVDNSKIFILSGDSGFGKSLYMKKTGESLKQAEFHNVIYLSSIDSVKDC